MNEKKDYYTELHATEIKDSAKHYATESVCAHFSTRAKVGTIAFEEAKQDAVDYYWDQQQRGWEGYTVGKTFVQTGKEEVSCMSPAWDYHKGRSFPVFEEVK
jgi:hypothetical protein